MKSLVVSTVVLLCAGSPCWALSSLISESGTEKSADIRFFGDRPTNHNQVMLVAEGTSTVLVEIPKAQLEQAKTAAAEEARLSWWAKWLNRHPLLFLIGILAGPLLLLWQRWIYKAIATATLRNGVVLPDWWLTFVPFWSSNKVGPPPPSPPAAPHPPATAATP